MRPSNTLAGLALAALAFAQPLQAQQPPAMPALPDSVRSMVQEMQTLRQRIGEVQDSAMQADPQLVEARQEVQEFVQAKVLEQHPDAQADMERLGSLQQEAVQAQAAQDTARLQEIVQEGTQIQQELQQAQAEALEREDVQARITAFEDRMVSAMAAIDPGIEEAIARMEDLASRLQAFQQGS